MSDRCGDASRGGVTSSPHMHKRPTTGSNGDTSSDEPTKTRTSTTDSVKSRASAVTSDWVNLMSAQVPPKPKADRETEPRRAHQRRPQQQSPQGHHPQVQLSQQQQYQLMKQRQFQQLMQQQGANRPAMSMPGMPLTPEQMRQVSLGRNPFVLNGAADTVALLSNHIGDVTCRSVVSAGHAATTSTSASQGGRAAVPYLSYGMVPARQPSQQQRMFQQQQQQQQSYKPQPLPGERTPPGHPVPVAQAMMTMAERSPASSQQALFMAAGMGGQGLLVPSGESVLQAVKQAQSPDKTTGVVMGLRSDKLFVCDWKNCARKGRPFNRKQDFKKHLRTHTQERPYACRHGDCDKTFSDPSVRTRHEATHCKRKFVTCPDCPKKFKQTSSARRHWLKVHKA